MNSPRIYTYKITFPDQGWWYWGVHKEKEYGEEYWGSPVTHKEKWKWFKFEKQILEFFNSWDEAKRVEIRLVKPDLNNPLCLNENAGGTYSLEAAAEGGKVAGRICKEQKKGFFAMTPEEWSNAGKKGGSLGGKRCYAKGKGLFGRSPEKIIKDCSKAGKIGGPIGGKKSRPSLEGRAKLSQTAKNTLQKYPHIIEKFKEAGVKARRKSVKVMCLSTGKEEIFESISEACRVKGLTASAITGVLQGKFKQHKGYFFEVV